MTHTGDNQPRGATHGSFTRLPRAYEMEAFDILPAQLRAAVAETAQKLASTDIHRALQKRLADGAPWQSALDDVERLIRMTESVEIRFAGGVPGVSVQRPEYGTVRTRRRRR